MEERRSATGGVTMAKSGQPPEKNVSDDLSDEALAQRSHNLSDALKKARVPDGDSVRDATSDARGMAQAMRMISEFVAGVLAGGAIGWGLDYVFGTSPLWLIVFLLLGFAAGFYNVVRAAGVVKSL
jgi:ATP synthase protein I